jgi:hypothetical protein
VRGEYNNIAAVLGTKRWICLKKNIPVLSNPINCFNRFEYLVDCPWSVLSTLQVFYNLV